MSNAPSSTWSARDLDAYLDLYGVHLPPEQRERMLALAHASADVGRRMPRMPSKYDEPAHTYRLPL